MKTKTHPQIIDTYENYYELDETGNLYRNGILVNTDIQRIKLWHGHLMTWKHIHWMQLDRANESPWAKMSELERECNDASMRKLLNLHNVEGRDYFNAWTSGHREVIKVGDKTIGYAYFNTGESEDYSVTITDPMFMSRINEVVEDDGRRITRAAYGRGRKDRDFAMSHTGIRVRLKNPDTILRGYREHDGPANFKDPDENFTDDPVMATLAALNISMNNFNRGRPTAAGTYRTVTPNPNPDQFFKGNLSYEEWEEQNDPWDLKNELDDADYKCDFHITPREEK